jgi:Holliday junction resolvase RusA-like endonuclease
MTVSFKVLGEPVGKGRPKFARVGDGVTTYTPRETRAYEERVRAAYRAAGGPHLGDRALCVRIVAYCPIPASVSKARRYAMAHGFELPTKKPDCDNILKIICDALNRCAYDDDKQIVRAEVVKKYTADIPRVEVTLYDGEEG